VDGAGSVIFGVTAVCERMCAPNHRRRIGRGEIDLVALVIAKFEQRGPNLQTLGALHETPPIGAAPEFPVGRHFKPDLFLHAHRRADAVILDALELVVSDLICGMAAEGLAQ
jgi:hypothetical protein